MQYGRKLTLGLYLVSTALCAVLFGLATLVALSLVSRNGELLIAFGLTWFVSLPVVVLLTLATMATYSRYARLKTWKQTLPFFVGQTVAVAVLAWVVTYWLDRLGLLVPIFEAIG